MQPGVDLVLVALVASSGALVTVALLGFRQARSAQARVAALVVALDLAERASGERLVRTREALLAADATARRALGRLAELDQQMESATDRLVAARRAIDDNRPAIRRGLHLFARTSRLAERLTGSHR